MQSGKWPTFWTRILFLLSGLKIKPNRQQVWYCNRVLLAAFFLDFLILKITISMV
jgi:hypothetical protein